MCAHNNARLEALYNNVYVHILNTSLMIEYIKGERRGDPAAKPTKLARLLKRVRREKSKPETAKSEAEA